jgi:phosphonopyruvate decarboxylase
MISPETFYTKLIEHGLNFFAGVPDSLLKDVCAYITDHAQHNYITANEGNAIALASGHYLATGNPGVVYMQNSGLGNAVNPLLSLNDPLVFGIPVLLLIGWRGEPDVHDEPQHLKQGRVTTELLETMGIAYTVLDRDSDLERVFSQALEALREDKPFACVIRKGSFASYKLSEERQDISSLSREQAIAITTSHISEDSFIVSTTGKISRELYEFREHARMGHSRDFTTVGSMGHCSQIALGIAIEKPDSNIFVYDGDGAALMHLGGAGLIGALQPKNLKHIIFNNAAHDSVGGQPTIGGSLDFAAIARDFHYPWTKKVETQDDLEGCLQDFTDCEGPALLEVRVSKGSREDLGRPKISMQDLKQMFMTELK